MAYTYIIFSKTLDTFYTGATQLNVSERLKNHNESSYGSSHFTSKAKDWEIFLCIEAQDYSHAIRMERKIKKMKSRKFIQNLYKYEELKQKIYNETLST